MQRTLILAGTKLNLLLCEKLKFLEIRSHVLLVLDRVAPVVVEVYLVSIITVIVREFPRRGCPDAFDLNTHGVIAIIDGPLWNESYGLVFAVKYDIAAVILFFQAVREKHRSKIRESHINYLLGDVEQMKNTGQRPGYGDPGLGP
jgi:hypothetical protein